MTRKVFAVNIYCRCGGAFIPFMRESVRFVAGNILRRDDDVYHIDKEQAYQYTGLYDPNNAVRCIECHARYEGIEEDIAFLTLQ